MRQSKPFKKVKVEYSTLYSERWERNFMVRSVGYGKPGAVYKSSNNYYDSKPDLQLIDSEEFVKNILLKHTKDQPTTIGDNKTYYINGITFKLICVVDYYLIKNEKMEKLLSYYEECMGARRDRRGKKEPELEKVDIDTDDPFWDVLSPEQRKHLKRAMEKEVMKS